MSIRNRKPLTVARVARHLMLVLVLVVTQFAGVVHAEVHDFHKHSQSCDVYQAMERSANFLVSDTLFVLDVHPCFFEFQASISTLQAESLTARSRGPPVFL